MPWRCDKAQHKAEDRPHPEADYFCTRYEACYSAYTTANDYNSSDGKE